MSKRVLVNKAFAEEDPIDGAVLPHFLELLRKRGMDVGAGEDDAFNGLAHLRAETQRWCLEVTGQRIHGTSRRQPRVVFQDEERHALLPWDGEPYEDHPLTHRQGPSRPSRGLPVCTVLGAGFRLPTGSEVEIRLDSKLVRIYHRGKLVKVHERQPKGGRSTDPDDYPAELTAYTMKAPDEGS